MTNSTIKYLDLFAGIGGISGALSNVAPSSECVMVAEFNKFSLQTYLANHQVAPEAVKGDITKVELSDIPLHDLILAGFPCQAFSLGGLRKGFEDTRGTLFFDVARIAKQFKPKVLFLENVKNLVAHDKGNTFKVIQQTLDEIGYNLSYRVINSKSLVPQKRDRIYMVATRKDLPIFDFDTVKFPDDVKQLSTILFDSKSSNLSGNPDIDTYLDTTTGQPKDKYTLSPKLWEFLQAHANKHASKGNGFGFGLNTPDMTARTLTARYYKDGSEVLIAQDNKNPRKLTPRECARLMGFPDSFKIPVSDTQAYRQFGNSVVVPVVQTILEQVVAQYFND